MNPDQISRWQVLFWAVVVEGGLAVIALGLGWLVGYPPWQVIAVEPVAVLRGVVVTLPMLLCFFLLVRWPVGPLKGIEEFVRSVVKPLFSRCSLWELALIAALAGIGEELLFRGVLQPMLVDGLGLATGIIIASVVFGLVHFITPTYAVLATLAGVYLGVVAVIGDNILDAVIAHGLYDFVALVYLVRWSKGSQPAVESEEGGEHEPLGSG